MFHHNIMSRPSIAWTELNKKKTKRKVKDDYIIPRLNIYNHNRKRKWSIYDDMKLNNKVDRDYRIWRKYED